MGMSMRFFKTAVVMLSCLTILPFMPSGASDNTTPPGQAQPLPAFTMPAALEPVLQQYRQGWTQATALERSALHWNQGVVIYLNQGMARYRNNHAVQKDMRHGEELTETRSSGFTVYSPGTIVLKENYVLEHGGPPRPASVTAMIKRENGYDPAMGDWQFVQFDPTGQILVNGSSRDPGVDAACAACHRGMVERDYVFSTLAPTEGGRS